MSFRKDPMEMTARRGRVALGASLSAALCVVAVSAQSPWRQAEVFAPASDISFSIQLPRNVYDGGERVAINYRITNTGKVPLYVPRPPEATGCLEFGGVRLSAWLENSAGQHASQAIVSSCPSAIPAGLIDIYTLAPVTPPSTPPTPPLTTKEKMDKVGVLLQATGHVDGTLSTQIPNGSPPGNYRVETVVRGWRESDFVMRHLDELRQLQVRVLQGEVYAVANLEVH